ncbi:hypothetical protein ACO0LO_01880 [Undibacterium sp. TJN25]|uniref:hypothetical protein n=1 Tax=Undibacterium sp. TJN25 TaxID=3413056 RepID=UPI003BF18735
MNKLRMIEWLLIAALFYALALIMLSAGYGGPLQTLTWKLGHVTMGGFAGYWLDRAAFRDRITLDSHALVMIRRAIVIFGAMYTLGAGM